jgi:hypothetical protein
LREFAYCSARQIDGQGEIIELKTEAELSFQVAKTILSDIENSVKIKRIERRKDDTKRSDNRISRDEDGNLLANTPPAISISRIGQPLQISNGGEYSERSERSGAEPPDV